MSICSNWCFCDIMSRGSNRRAALIVTFWAGLINRALCKVHRSWRLNLRFERKQMDCGLRGFGPRSSSQAQGLSAPETGFWSGERGFRRWNLEHHEDHLGSCILLWSINKNSLKGIVVAKSSNIVFSENFKYSPFERKEL
jgi:hypothetical protein